MERWCIISMLKACTAVLWEPWGPLAHLSLLCVNSHQDRDRMVWGLLRAFLKCIKQSWEVSLRQDTVPDEKERGRERPKLNRLSKGLQCSPWARLLYLLVCVKTRGGSGQANCTIQQPEIQIWGWGRWPGRGSKTLQAIASAKTFKSQAVMSWARSG